MPRKKKELMITNGAEVDLSPIIATPDEFKTPIELDLQGKLCIDLFLQDGMSAKEAVRVAYDKDLTEGAASKFFLTILNDSMLREYYEATVEELREEGRERSLWTREMSITTLHRLITKVEDELYREQKPLTMPRVTAIISAVKELNMLSGFITEKHQILQAQVHFSGDNNMLD